MFANLPLSIRTFSTLIFTFCLQSLSLNTYAQATQSVGSLEVDRFGAAVYILPISAPNGVGGVKPNITALYNSQAANGLLGKGGSIGGLSVIKRCPQTLVHDGINKAISWSADDRFCIDTQRLMLVAGSQGAAESQYKTEIDNGVVYTAKGGATGNPDYFEARAEDGATLIFGGAATAKEQGAATMTWALSQYKDAANNIIEYMYEGAAADGLRIKRINYAFPIPNTTANPGAYIEFIYKDRDDPISKYVAGYEFRINKLLTHISSYSLSGLLHRSYQFELATSDGLAGYVSRWQSIKECTSQSYCFDATQFEWGRTQKNITTGQIETKNIKMDFLGGIVSGKSFQLNSQVSNCCAVQSADLNGNGIADFAWISKSDSGIYSYVTINDLASLPSDASRFSIAVAEAKYDFTSEMLPLEFSDINADGIADVITPLQGSGGYSDTNHFWGINYSRRESTAWYLGREYRQFGKYDFVKSIDLDGDGFEEILGFNNRSIDFTLHKTQKNLSEPVSSFWYRSLSSHTSILRLSDIPTANNIYVEYSRDMVALGDLNNDGKKDFVLLLKLGYPATNEQIYKINWYEQENNTLVFRGTLYQESNKPLSTQPDNKGGYKLSDFVAFTKLKVVDINGDGLDDIVFQKNSVWMYAISKGNGLLPFVAIPNKSVSKPAISSTFIDVNNDGKADYIYGESTYTIGANPFWDYTNPSVYVRYWNSKIAAFDDPVLIRTTSDFPVLFADMNGDGFVDVVENQRNESDRTKDKINVYGFTNNVGNATVGFQGVLDQDTIVSVKKGATVDVSIDYQTLIKPKQIDILSCAGNVPCFDFSVSSHYKPLKIEVTRVGNNLMGVSAPIASGASDYYTKTNEPFLGLNNPYVGGASVFQYVAPLPIVTRVKKYFFENSDKKYYYATMRSQAGGRGLLGFEKTAVEDAATGVRTETFWRQDWPFTGLSASKITWNKFNKAISELESTLAINPVGQSKVFKVNVSNTVEKQYETGINDAVQGGLISINNPSLSQTSSSASAPYTPEPAILELLMPGERSIKYVAAGTSVGLKAVALSEDGTLWADSSGNVPVVKFYADDYTYLGEAKADGTPFNWIPLASKTYLIKAKLFLGAGVTLQSRVAGVVVSDASGYPNVDFLDTIRNGVKYSTGDLIHLVANATDKDGSIVNVKFYANNTLVGTGNSIGSNNYRFDWTPTSAGIYNIKAIATDNANNKSESKTLEIFYGVNSSSSSSAVSSTPAASLTLPLTYPLTNSVLGGSLQLGSSLKNSSGQQLYMPDGSVPLVRFYANGHYVGESRADGYWFQWKPTAAGVYDVVAVAMFNNEQVISQTATLIVKGSATANIELTAPKYYGAKYDTTDYVGISVNINDSTFKIAKVVFYANDQELATDSTLPYSFAWLPATSGIYTLKAIAIDVNGNAFVSAHKLINYGVVTGGGESSSSAYSTPSSSQSSSLSSVRDPIKFELTSPLERTTDQYGLGAEVVLGAPVIGVNGGIWTDATGNAAQVDYYANDQLLTGLRKDPRGYYSFWKPSVTGTYSIKAVARINENKTISTGYGTVSVINANAPTVSLVHPAADRFLKLGESLNLVANASDSDGNLLSVNFYANEERLSLPVQGTNPFNLLWTPYITGEYLIRAEAMDKTYVKSTTGTIRVSVVNPGLKPVVTLLTPDNGSEITYGSKLTLFANAKDFDGSVARVEFYANDQLIGASSSAPYSISYTPASAGSYVLKAVAYDNLDNSTASAVSQISYGLQAPAFNIIDPDDDCFYGFKFRQQTDDLNDLIYELYERSQGAEWSVNPVSKRSLSRGDLPPFSTYFNDHEPGNFEYRARVCPVNNPAACSPFSATFPVFVYENCKSIPLPNVQLVEPPSKLKLGDTVVLEAEAQITNNKPINVRFYYGEKLLGTDNAAPYTISWTPTETGRDNLYALAETSFDATGISDLYPVDILTPEDYANGTTGSSSRSSSSKPTATVSSSASSVSFHSSSQSSLIPQIALFTPEAGKATNTYLSEEAMLFAAVYDQDLRPWRNRDGSKPRIEYYANNQLLTNLRDDAASGIKYWQPAALGNYGIKAIAYLDDSQTVTTNVGILSVVKPLPPSISIDTVTGVIYSGELLTLTGKVVDPDKQTKEVKFFVNGEQVALPDFVAPYEAAWIPTVPGSYQVEAELLDKSGNSVRSPVSTFTVAPAVLPDFDDVRGVSDLGDALLQGLKWTPLNHSDMLVAQTPNSSKISYNKLTKFNIHRPLKILNKSDAYTNGLMAAKLIVIDAAELTLNSSIEIVGEPADILLLNASTAKRIGCSNCGFKNAGRVTLAVATTSVPLTISSGSIGTLTSQVGGEVSIDNLRASNVISVEFLAETVRTNGIINTQQYTTDAEGKHFGDVAIPGISKVVGSGGVSVLHGRMDVDYEKLSVNQIRTGAVALNLDANISTGAVNLIAATPINLNGSLNTASDFKIVTKYQGKAYAQPELIQIKSLSSDGVSKNSIAVNSAVITDGKAELISQGDITLTSPQASIAGHTITMNAGYNFISYGNVKASRKERLVGLNNEEPKIQIGAKLIENRGSMDISEQREQIDGAWSTPQVSGVLTLVSQTNVFNRFGGVLKAKTIKVAAQDGRIRNGSLYAFDDPIKEHEAIAAVTHDTSAISTLSALPVSDTKPYLLPKALIQGVEIQLEAGTSVENINPYMEPIKLGSAEDVLARVSRDAQSHADDVQIEAVNKLTIIAPTYVLNSSASLGVSEFSLVPSLVVRSPQIRNERYYSYTVLDAVDETKQVIEQNPGATTTTTSTVKGVKARFGFYSPPGVIYSFAPVQMEFGDDVSNTRSGLLNNAGFVDFYSNANVSGIGRITSLGVKLDKLAYETTATTRTVLDECITKSQWAGDRYVQYVVCEQGNFSRVKTSEGQYLEPELDNTLFAVAGRLDAPGMIFSATNHEVLKAVQAQAVSDYIAAQKARKYYQYDPSNCSEKIDVIVSQNGLSIVTNVTYTNKAPVNICPAQGYGESKSIAELVAAKVSNLPYELNPMINRYESWKSRAAQ